LFEFALARVPAPQSFLVGGYLARGIFARPLLLKRGKLLLVVGAEHGGTILEPANQPGGEHQRGE
jgi:hypothetical protein